MTGNRERITREIVRLLVRCPYCHARLTHKRHENEKTREQPNGDVLRTIKCQSCGRKYHVRDKEELSSRQTRGIPTPI